MTTRGAGPDPDEAIAVIAVAYHSIERIESCLDSVAALPRVREVVVVDHGTDGTGSVARRRGALVIEDPTNPGFGAGQNRGLAATSAPWVLLLNPDAQVLASGVESGLDLLRQEPRLALVQGSVLGGEGKRPERSQGRELGPQHLWGRSLRLRRLLQFRLVSDIVRAIPQLADHVVRVPEGPQFVESLAATAILARRAALESVGGFDDLNYFLYGEDLDLCRRLRNAGWLLMAIPDAWAVHVGGGSAESAWMREISWWEGTMIFAARWWSFPAFACGLAASATRGVSLVAARPREARRVLDAMVRSPVRARLSRRADPSADWGPTSPASSPGQNNPKGST